MNDESKIKRTAILLGFLQNVDAQEHWINIYFIYSVRI